MEGDIPKFKVNLFNVIGTHHYELPPPETIGAIVFGGTSVMETEFDLIIEVPSRLLQRTINDIVYPTNRAACETLGLIGDYQEWAGALEEAALHASSEELRNLESDVIIWDEAPMNDLRFFESLDRCLKDILDNPQTLFGGKSIIIGGDFRQTLPAKKNALKPEISDASITVSYIWVGFTLYTLHQNMRLSWTGIRELEKNVSKASHRGFYILATTFQKPSAKDLQKKVMVFPKNETTDTINTHVLSLLNHEWHVYLSSDEAIPHGNDGGETELLYLNEYLNTLKFAGLPPHRL
nr:DNA helicase [Tanacetum cinerariifolium]